MRPSSSAATAASIPVLTSIVERIAAFTADQFIPPERPAPETPAQIVGQLNEHQRRLWTLQIQVLEEHNAKRREVNGLRKQVSDATKQGRNALQILKNLLGGGLTKDVVERLEKAEYELTLLDLTHQVLKGLFWLEVQTQYGELADKPSIALYNDWTVGWQEVEELDLFGLGGVEFDIVGEMPAGRLAEILRGSRRHTRQRYPAGVH
ncbi:MAG TPA: hypothetical protein VEA36_00755 [Candidatus Paceibacterota bacterium]|nr:hypothetical protein [Candidatus Paceibacterota bacterium]